MPLHTTSDDELVSRFRGEYLESPGLYITALQACRLWRLDEQTCRRVLRRLVGAGFLLETIDGRFRRLPDGDRLVEVHAR